MLAGKYLFLPYGSIRCNADFRVSDICFVANLVYMIYMERSMVSIVKVHYILIIFVNKASKPQYQNKTKISTRTGADRHIARYGNPMFFDACGSIFINNCIVNQLR